MNRVAFVAIALLAPRALAAEEEARFEDATLDAFPPVANAWADIIGAAMIANETTIALEIGLAANPVMQQGVGYLFLVSDGARDWYGALVTPGDEQWFYGLWAGEEIGPWDGKTAKGSYTTGSPATVTIEIPRYVFEGVADLSQPRAYSINIFPDALPSSTYLVYDEAVGDVALTLAPPSSAVNATTNATAPLPPSPAESPAEDLGPAAVATPDNARRETPAPMPFLALLAGAALRCLRPRNDRAMPRR